MFWEVYDRLFWKRRSMLNVVWPEVRLDDPPADEMPPGYRLRTFEPADLDAFLSLMADADMPGWDRARFEHTLAYTLAGGLYLGVQEETGALVGTARATHQPLPRHPGGGEIAWCAVHRAHRGRRIMRALAARATRHLIDAGYRRIYAATHDFRLPSIKTFLNLGFQPFLYAPDMEARWRRACSKLGWPFEPERWVSPGDR